MNCPICERSFSENDAGIAMPFCSIRCKQIDAARWLDERYGLPYMSEETADKLESDVLAKE